MYIVVTATGVITVVQTSHGEGSRDYVLVSHILDLAYKTQVANTIMDLRWDPLPVYDDVIKWKHFPPYWPFVRGINRSPANSPQKDQWCGGLMFSLICALINGWENNREAGELRRQGIYYNVNIMGVHILQVW